MPNSIQSKLRQSQRFTTTMLTVGIFLFFLGFGNLLIGLYKSHQYQRLLETAEYELKRQEKPLVPLVQSPLHIDTYTEHVNRLKHRLDYYTLVTLGGKIFLALCGILLLAALMIYRYPQEDFVEE